MLLSRPYSERLVALAVDEAHCVKLWGDEFRKAFAQIGDLRSIIPTHVKILALTATATTETFHIVTRRLAMWQPVLVALPPYRQNIAYKIYAQVTINKFSEHIYDELILKRRRFPKTVIYVRKYRDCSRIYLLLKKMLGEDIIEPPGYPNVAKFRLIDIFSSVMTSDKKDHVLKLFSESGSILRLLIATTSFGMGIDCQDIRRIIHWGAPSTLEEYAQETGRAGRDGEPAVAILYRGVGGKNANAKVKAYLANTAICRRKFSFKNFFCIQTKILLLPVFFSVVIYVYVLVIYN